MKHVLGCSMVVLALVFVVADACSQAKASPDSLRKLSKEMYARNCAGCHGERGQGAIGPNLTDKYWLHGGGEKNVARTIREGVGGKGMISWNGVLSAEEIERMTALVLAFQGTDPPRAKKAEGELDETLRKD